MTRKTTVTIIPFTYFGINSGFKEAKVFVIKGDEHPDPSKKLTWGIKADGSQMPGDYNAHFTKSGKPIQLQVDLTESQTAMQDKKLGLKAIYDYIGALV